MKLPQFTLRDMFLATTLIAVGVAMNVIASTRANSSASPAALYTIMWIASWSTIGPGIGALLKRKVEGVLIGLPIAFLFYIAIYLLPQLNLSR